MRATLEIQAWQPVNYPTEQGDIDANDPIVNGIMSWDLYRERWGSRGEYAIDGNLKSVEYGDRLKTIAVPALITAGDHDE